MLKVIQKKEGIKLNGECSKEFIDLIETLEQLLEVIKSSK
jgi:hypothetical protein